MRARARVGLLLGLVAVGVGTAAASPRVFTGALPPSQEALDRLNLRMSWHDYVPMDGPRDGFVSIQLQGKTLFVQTKSGLVTLMDAETGRVQWRWHTGQAYLPSFPLAFNSRFVFVSSGTYFYALDRDTGTVRWKMSPESALSAPPIADDEQLFLCTADTRVYAFRLPHKTYGDEPKSTTTQNKDTTKPRPAREDRALTASYSLTKVTSVSQTLAVRNSGPVPLMHWRLMSNVRLELTPLLSKDMLFVASPDQTYFGMERNLEDRRLMERYRGKTNGLITAAPGVYETTAYVGSEDASLYAIDIERGDVQWRYTAGTAIIHTPVATAQDVYAVSRSGGLVRINRLTGEPVWHNPRGNFIENGVPQAMYFLAANPKFIYANDAAGRLLVLDRQHGTQLSSYDTRGFGYPFSNSVSDRLYLASDNGLIVCLHDRDYPEPYHHRLSEERSEDPTVLLRDTLNKPVSEQGRQQKEPMIDLLHEIRKRYRFDFEIGRKAFSKLKRETPEQLPASMPHAENLPLKELIQRILDQQDAHFEAIGDRVIILPGKPKVAP